MKLLVLKIQSEDASPELKALCCRIIANCAERGIHVSGMQKLILPAYVRILIRKAKCFRAFVNVIRFTDYKHEMLLYEGARVINNATLNGKFHAYYPYP